MVRDLDRLLVAIPKTGMSRDFSTRLLPRLARFYSEGRSVDEAMDSLHVGRGEIESIFHRFRQIYDVAGELPASSVVLNVYRELEDRDKPLLLHLPEEVCSLIERPQEGHGFYMGYKDFGVFSFGEQRWAIALGNCAYGYLGVRGYGSHHSQYERDLFVSKLSQENNSHLQTQFASAVNHVTGLGNSLVVARKDTGLVFPGLIDEGLLGELVGPSVNDLRLNQKGGILYKKELVPIIASGVEKVLGRVHFA